jgi:antitoxin HicB
MNSTQRISNVRFVYPYEIERDGNSIIVHFPDVPGASTQVDPGEDFQAMVQDCLVAALGGYVILRRAPPRPSAVRERPAVTLDILTSAKLALAMVMSDENVNNVELAKRLGVNEKVVRRMLDLDHISRIDRLETALAHFEIELQLSVRQKPITGHEMHHHSV